MRVGVLVVRTFPIALSLVTHRHHVRARSPDSLCARAFTSQSVSQFTGFFEAATRPPGGIFALFGHRFVAATGSRLDSLASAHATILHDGDDT